MAKKKQGSGGGLRVNTPQGRAGSAKPSPAERRNAQRQGNRAVKAALAGKGRSAGAAFGKSGKGLDFVRSGRGGGLATFKSAPRASSGSTSGSG